MSGPSVWVTLTARGHMAGVEYPAPYAGILDVSSKCYRCFMAARTKRDLGYRAWLAFHRMRITLLPPLIRHLSEHSGLSEADYQVFIGLTSVPGATMKPSDLAKELGWDMGRVSHQVSRMEARGLLSRQPCPLDARSCWIGLSREGRALARKAIPAQAREVERLFTAALTMEQLQSLIEISEAVEAYLARDGLVHATHDHADSAGPSAAN